jgi:hypothetical protein
LEEKVGGDVAQGVPEFFPERQLLMEFFSHSLCGLLGSVD